MILLIDGLPNENMLSMRIMQGFYCCLGDFCLQHSAQCNGNVDLQFFATRKLFKQNVFAINISSNDKYTCNYNNYLDYIALINCRSLSIKSGGSGPVSNHLIDISLLTNDAAH